MVEKVIDTAPHGEKLIVGIADMKISDHPGDEIITYSLGSCLGIAAYDKSTRIGGLMHVMLPAADLAFHPEKADSKPYMYVDTGVPKFLNAVFRKGARKSELEIKVAGGAFLHFKNRMDPFFKIGKRNFMMLRKLLWKNGIMMKSYDIGKDYPRTMTLRIDSGEVFVKGNGATKKL